MGATTKTVGGGNAVGTAQGFNDFLQQQLMGMGGMQQQQSNNLEQRKNELRQSGMPVGMQEQLMKAMDAQHAQQQGQMSTQGGPATQGGPTAFQSIFDQMSKGQVQDQSGSGGLLANILKDPNYFKQQTYGNTYTAPGYVDPTTTQLNTNYGGTGQADLSGINRIGGQGIDTTQGMGSVPTSGLDGLFKSMLSQGANGVGQVGAQGVSLAAPTQFDMNNPYFKAIADKSNMTTDRNAAELRARFGAAGAGSMGTGAQYAEGNMRATQAPELTIAMQQALQGLQQQDLAERSTGANVALGSAGQNLQGQIANQNAGLTNSSNILQSILSGRGQDLNAAGTARGQDISQMGLGIQQLLGMRGQDIDQRGQDINAALTNQNQGNVFTQNNNAQNSQNMQTNNQNSIIGAQNRNNFNTTNAGNTAQYGLGANQLNSNNAQNSFSQLLQAISQGQQGNQFGAGLQGNILQMLFGGMQQSNGLGTPGAQTVQQQNPWMQLLGQGLNTAGQFAGARA